MTREERDAAIAAILGDPVTGWRVLAIGHVADEYAASQCARIVVPGPPVVIGPDGPKPLQAPGEGDPQ